MADLVFADGFGQAALRLFECDEDVLLALLQDDGSVRVKGKRSDQAVLCTTNQTYSLRLAESSNTLLLATERCVPKQALPRAAMTVEASATGFFELVRTAPHISGLLSLLGQPYSGDVMKRTMHRDSNYIAIRDSVLDAACGRPTLAELDDMVRGSPAEVRAALRAAKAMQISGCWCVLEMQLERAIMECVLSLCVECEWPLDAIPADECISKCLQQDGAGFDEAAIRATLSAHAVSADEVDWDAWVRASERAVISLDPDSVCRFRARIMLSECDAWPCAQFMEVWEQALPAGLLPSLSRHLEGIAVVTEGDCGNLPMVRSLPLASLPLRARERFEALFQLKRAWSKEELTPYVQDLLDPGRSMETLVLQHARSVASSKGFVAFVSRH